MSVHLPNAKAVSVAGTFNDWNPTSTPLQKDGANWIASLNKLTFVEMVTRFPDEPSAIKFLEAVRWARCQGAQLVSCSCIMPNWSDGEGGGAVHEELARILALRVRKPK